MKLVKRAILWMNPAYKVLDTFKWCRFLPERCLIHSEGCDRVQFTHSSAVGSNITIISDCRYCLLSWRVYENGILHFSEFWLYQGLAYSCRALTPTTTNHLDLASFVHLVSRLSGFASAVRSAHDSAPFLVEQSNSRSQISKAPSRTWVNRVFQTRAVRKKLRHANQKYYSEYLSWLQWIANSDSEWESL
jgi:hypothetical protein